MSGLEVVAKPGDPDLTLDLDGVTVVSVVRVGWEILVRFVGGYGMWVSPDGRVTHFPPGDPKARVTDGEWHLGFPDGSDVFLTEFVERLNRWRDGAIPLRMCCAPGRMTAVIEDRDNWLPLPSNPFPEPDPQ